jgi:hypothetical protein
MASRRTASSSAAPTAHARKATHNWLTTLERTPDSCLQQVASVFGYRQPRHESSWAAEATRDFVELQRQGTVVFRPADGPDGVG